MQAFHVDQLERQRVEAGGRYLEFLRVPDLSVGMYVLRAGETDPQLPHTEDEVYAIVSGKGKILVADEEQVVSAGSIVYVAANVVHRFFDIADDLTIIVFFAPAEYSKAQR
jgi:mannose-6-phosphate isomerase-like protein (cupin superfamily)